MQVEPTDGIDLPIGDERSLGHGHRPVDHRLRSTLAVGVGDERQPITGDTAETGLLLDLARAQARRVSPSSSFPLGMVQSLWLSRRTSRSSTCPSTVRHTAPPAAHTRSRDAPRAGTRWPYPFARPRASCCSRAWVSIARGRAAWSTRRRRRGSRRVGRRRARHRGSHERAAGCGGRRDGRVPQPAG